MTGPRPDASMDLLRSIRETALDPSYGTASARRQNRAVVVVPTAVVIGLLLGLAFGATTRAAPEGADERAQLVARIQQLDREQADLRARTNDLARANVELERTIGGVPAETLDRIGVLAPRVGTQPVTGPGLRVTVDDGPDADSTVARVLDADLRMLVNALWQSGAEAIQVNGHRLSARTAIREAGDAITVDYRSLTRPYGVEGIGDPAGLESGLARSAGGAWWRTLQQEYQVGYAVERVDDITMDADPGLGVDRARAAR